MEKYNQLIKKAKTFFELHQFENANNCLLSILKNFQLDADKKLNLYLLIADINTRLNNFKDANDYLLRYLKINPNIPKVFNLIANNFSKVRQFKKAEEYYLKAINLQQDYEEALINLALLFDNLGKKQDALNYYKKAIMMNPNNLGVLFNIYKLENKTLNEKQISSIEEYLSSDNKDFFNTASGYYLLAKNENKKKNITKEISFLEKAKNYSFIIK